MGQAEAANGQSVALSTAVAVVLVGLLATMLSGYALRTARAGRRQERRAEQMGGTALVGLWIMEAFYWAMRAPARGCVRIGLHPDALTWASLVVTIAAAPAAAWGHFSIAGALVVFGAVFDALDGQVARQLGVASDAGEMLDAVLDRYADAAPLLGLAVFYRFSAWQMVVPLVALIGAMLVSYVRAKAEAMGLSLPGGLMRRHERIAYLSVALVIGPELSVWLGSPGGVVHPASIAIVAAIAVLSNYSAIKLVVLARRALAQRRGGG